MAQEISRNGEARTPDQSSELKNMVDTMYGHGRVQDSLFKDPGGWPIIDVKKMGPAGASQISQLRGQIDDMAHHANGMWKISLQAASACGRESRAEGQPGPGRAVEGHHRGGAAVNFDQVNLAMVLCGLVAGTFLQSWFSEWQYRRYLRKRQELDAKKWREHMAKENAAELQRLKESAFRARQQSEEYK